MNPYFLVRLACLLSLGGATNLEVGTVRNGNIINDVRKSCSTVVLYFLFTEHPNDGTGSIKAFISVNKSPVLAVKRFKSLAESADT